MPNGIASDPFHRYIVLSFVNGTLVLQISEDIEEVQETGFLSQEPTLAVQQIGEDALLQVHPRGIRHILADKRCERVEGSAGPHDRPCDDEQTSSCRSVEFGGVGVL